MYSLPEKFISLDTAASWIPSGCTLALGGMTLYRRPLAFVRALLQRHRLTGQPRDLTLLCFTAGLESDLLVGAGMVARVRTCYFGLEIFGLAPMFTYFANRGEIEIVEETEASLAFGLRARAAGVGFMPGRGWLGTDLPGLRPDVRTVIDPYSGEELVAFPAIHTDFAVIHALRVDIEGNAQIGANKGVDQELVLTAERVILTTEEIVPPLQKADLVGPLVHGLAIAPHGALPTSCHPLYPLDGEAMLAYTEQVSDPASYEAYLDNWLQPDDQANSD
jgi:glutaconate CoA-transferase, subunit A